MCMHVVCDCVRATHTRLLTTGVCQLHTINGMHVRVDVSNRLAVRTCRRCESNHFDPVKQGGQTFSFSSWTSFVSTTMYVVSYTLHACYIAFEWWISRCSVRLLFLSSLYFDYILPNTVQLSSWQRFSNCLVYKTCVWQLLRTFCVYSIKTTLSHPSVHLDGILAVMVLFLPASFC